MNRFLVFSFTLSLLTLACGGSGERGKIDLGGPAKGIGPGINIKATIEDKELKLTCLNLAELINTVSTDKSLNQKLARAYVSDLRVLDFDVDPLNSSEVHESAYAQQVLLLDKIQDEKIAFYETDYASNFKNLTDIKSVVQADCQNLSITDMENKKTEYSISKNKISINQLLLSPKDGESEGDILFKRRSNNIISLTHYYKSDFPTDCKKKDDLTKNLIFSVEDSYQWDYEGDELLISTQLSNTLNSLSTVKVENLPGVGRQSKSTTDFPQVKIGSDRFALMVAEVQKLTEIKCD